MAITIGDKAPCFELEDQNGDLFNLEEKIGEQHILLYFYPKDETPGCITEACTFRDNIEQFNGLDCKVVGISKDNQNRHSKFSKHYALPFALLSDTNNKVRKLYGVKHAIPGILPGRKTYLIDKKGIITHIFEYQFKPKQHVIDAIEALKNV